MTKEDIIQTTLKDSNYHLSLFSEEELLALRRRIVIKESKGKKAAFVTCIIRGKDVQLKPEEIVRQLYAARLIEQYGYPQKRLAFEYPVTFGREKKSDDIVVFDKDRPDTPYIIVELVDPFDRDLSLTQEGRICLGGGGLEVKAHWLRVVSHVMIGL
jgi:type I restriction enzyme M protein